MIPPDELNHMRGCIGLDFPVEAMQRLFGHITHLEAELTRVRELEAQCAAMREALHHYVTKHTRQSYDMAKAALASGAGRVLLERLGNAEEALVQHQHSLKGALERAEKAESAVGSEAWNATKARARASKARAQAFEECAEIAERPDGSGVAYEEAVMPLKREIAKAIRAKAGGT